MPSNQWQPIDTVPEGITVDVWVEGLGRFSDARLTQDRWYYWSLDKWQFVPMMFEPCHWRPIPEDPNDQ